VRAALAAAALGLGLALASHAAEEPLGRLFFTPEQREALDARRRARIPDKPAAATIIESPTTRLDGRVVRSGGKSTVWVNGTPIPEGSQPEGMRVTPRRGEPAEASLSIGESDRQVDLKVGETLDRGTGEVKSNAGDARIRVERGSARKR
jgi:hypothetical protein